MLAPFKMIVDAAIPARCPGCGAITREDHRFCAACWSDLRFIAPPWCSACNLPMAFDQGQTALCGQCLAEPPKHSGIRAAVAYGPIARALVLKLKYGRRTGYAETAARHMQRLMPANADLLIPVPLHRWRLWSRGFNQAALIAQSMSKRTGIPCEVTILRRVRATPVLQGLGRSARAKAVQQAFAVDPGKRALIRGKSILLVDDVHTSGATTNACVGQLMRAGAAKVTILCWARVIDGDLPAGHEGH